MVSSKVFIALCDEPFKVQVSGGHYCVCYDDGGVCDFPGRPLSSLAASAECAHRCEGAGVVCCSFHLPDGRLVCSSVVV